MNIYNEPLVALTSNAATNNSTLISLVVLVGAIVAYAVNSFLLAKIFAKAGIEQWRAWVPIYSNWIFLELGGQKGWIALLLLGGIIPFVGFVAPIIAAVFLSIAAYRITLSLRGDGIWVVAYILIPVVWLAVFAFNDSTWEKKADPSLEGYSSY